jgi:hypothetical protein
MSKWVILALSLMVAVVAMPVARLMAGQSTPAAAPETVVCEVSAPDEAPIQLAQAVSECRKLGYSCGNQVINGNSACCEGLVCNNGACANFRRANESCGAGVPPCAPGLTCQAGVCR